MSDWRIESTPPARTELSGGNSNARSSSNNTRACIRRASPGAGPATRRAPPMLELLCELCKRPLGLVAQVLRPGQEPYTTHLAHRQLFGEDLECLAIHVLLVPKNLAAQLALSATMATVTRAQVGGKRLMRPAEVVVSLAVKRVSPLGSRDRREGRAKTSPRRRVLRARRYEVGG
jgi:hypothetical protein